MLRFAAMLIALFAFAVGAAASDELGSMAWFNAEWEKAQLFALPPKVVVRYDFITYPSMTASEVDALAASIRGFPDHPGHFRVERQRRLLELGLETETATIWFWNEKNWRCNEETALKMTPFVDFGRRGDRLWAYTPPQLTLTTMESMPHDRNYAAAIDSRTEYIARIVLCGFATALAGDIEPVSASWKGGTWIGIAQNQSGNKIIEWRGHSQDGHMIVDQWRVLRNDEYPKGVGLTVHFDAWVDHSVFGEFTPTHSRWVGATGNVQYEMFIREYGGLTKPVFEKVVRVPSRGSLDAIRGKVDPATLADFRPGKGVLTTYADEKTGVVEASVSLPNAVEPTGASTTVWIGRVLGVLALSFGVFLVWNRRS